MLKHLTVVLLVLAALAGAAVAGADGAARPTVTVQSSDYGPVLWDGGDRALYAFTADRVGTSRCSGACAKACGLRDFSRALRVASAAWKA